MERFFIVRDAAEDRHDPHIVWNWRERCWAFDIDGVYDEDGSGWNYLDKSAATRRAKKLAAAKQHWVKHPGGQNGIRNVRVIGYDELKELVFTD